MARSPRPWWLALAVSLLLHGVMIGGVSWTLPQEAALPEPILFEARLVSVAAPDVASPQPVAKPPAPNPPAHKTPAHKMPPLAASLPEAPTPAVVVPPESAAETASLEPAVNVEAVPVAQRGPESIEQKPVLAEVLPPLNPLPPRIDLRYQVSYGLASGEQTLVWVNEGGQRYTLISVAEATGLAGIFYHGKFVQTSRGRITPRGLQPEAFWDQRGDKRSSAQFDSSQGHLTLNPANGTPRHFKYEGEVQDALSLFFQMALTAPPPAGTLTYSVFNGKKLRDYSYTVRGEALLETAVGSLRTLHLARVTDSDGRFEIWLAIDRHYLPVRVLKSDDKGNEVELKVKSIAP